MQPRRLLVLPTLMLLLQGACAPAGPAPLSDADKAAIQATIDASLKIGNTTPLDAPAFVKAYYADDAILMPSNQPALSGAGPITEWFKALPPVSGLKFTTDEIEGFGGVAYLRGRYSFTMLPPGAAPIPDSGKYLEIWKKQADGSWRSARDIFNSDLPLPPPPVK